MKDLQQIVMNKMRKKIQQIVHGLFSSSDESMSMSSSSEEEERKVDEEQNVDYEIPDIPIDGYNI